MASPTTLNKPHLLSLKNVYASVKPHVTVKQNARALFTVFIISDA